MDKRKRNILLYFDNQYRIPLISRNGIMDTIASINRRFADGQLQDQNGIGSYGMRQNFKVSIVEGAHWLRIIWTDD